MYAGGLMILLDNKCPKIHQFVYWVWAVLLDGQLHLNKSGILDGPVSPGSLCLQTLKSSVLAIISKIWYCRLALG